VASLQNSKPRHPPGARRLRSKPAGDEIISVTLVLRPASPTSSRQQAIRTLAGQSPRQRKHLEPKEFVKRHGARQKDLALIAKFAKKNGLHVIEADRASRSVILSGTLQAFSNAFQVEFAMHRHEGQTYRSHQSEIRIPSSLNGIVQAVLGLENRALMSHHAFIHAGRATRHMVPYEVVNAYEFPTKADGKGQQIAIIELGGGYYKEDIKKYFQNLKLKVPQISTVEIDNHRNDPASRDLIKRILDVMGVKNDKTNQMTIDPSDAAKALWTIEATLDIELAGSFANGASIVVYFAPNNAQGKYHALSSALHNEQYPPTIISCSWGAVEENLTPDFVESIDQLFQDAVLKGVSICFSSGDRGEDPDKSGSPRVQFPASSPHVLACGGTHWILPETKLKEVVWSEKLPTFVAQSGGGVSKVFATPEWQSSADVKSKTEQQGRGVPDVAGKADMTTGYKMIVGGYDAAMGGTSSVVPMWAGLIARLNQKLGKNIGFLTPFLYRKGCTEALSDITEGNNGTHYQAGPGWDACTGLGTPNGNKLLAALKNSS
jgi:kumamolisin